MASFQILELIFLNAFYRTNKNKSWSKLRVLVQENSDYMAIGTETRI